MTIGDIKFNLETIDNLNRIARIKVCQEASKTIASMESKFAEIANIATRMNATNGQRMTVREHDGERFGLDAVGVDELHDFANAIIEVIEDDGDEP